MAALRSSIRHYRLFSSTTSATDAALTLSEARARLRSEHDPDKALDVYNNFADTKTSPMATRSIQDLTIKRLARSRRFADVEKIIEAQKTDPKITQENFFSTLIRSYGIAGMHDHAFKLYNQMEELGTPRSSVSFNAMLCAYNHCKKFDQVPKLFDEMPKKYGFLPDKVSYGIFIKSYCAMSLPEVAFGVLKEMEEKGIEITTISYTTILDSLYKERKVEEAEKLWKQMIEKGCELDVAAYNVRLSNVHHGESEGVLAVIEEMQNAGLKPDTISYNYLFTCYCKNGKMDEAKKVFLDLKKNGCSPNAATFRLHIYHLCMNGEFDKAHEVFKESVEKDKIPNFGTLKILVEGLLKKSKRKEAKGVIRSVKKKISASFLKAWEKLELELGLNKEEPPSTETTSASPA